MKFKQLNEMAYPRDYIIEKCASLGNQFAIHFNKIVKEGKDSLNFNHHCHEMQTWWNRVRDFRIKPSGKSLNTEQYIDWFFTAGKTTEEIIDNVEIYDKLIIQLLSNKNKSIKEIMEQIIDE